MNGELFDFKDWDIGKLEGYPTVFSVGNVVTGKGNIVASRKHATQVSEAAIEAYLGISEGLPADREAALEARKTDDRGAEAAANVLTSLSEAEAPSAQQVTSLLAKIAARHESIGFDDYKSWREKVGEPC